MQNLEKDLIGMVVRDGLDTYLEAVKAGMTSEGFLQDVPKEIWQVLEENSRQNSGEPMLSAVQRLGEQHLNFVLDAITDAPVIVSIGWMVNQITGKRWLQTSALALSSLANSLTHSTAIDRIEAIKSEISLLLDRLIKSDKINVSDVEYSNSIKTFIDEIEQRILDTRSGVQRGLPITLKCLQESLGGWLPGRLYILAARTSVGKTTMAINFASTAAEAGAYVYFCSNEMSDLEILEKDISRESGVIGSKISKGAVSDDEADRFMTAARKLYGRKITVGMKAGRTIEQFEASCIRLKREKKLDLVILDYVQQMQCQKGRFHSRHHELTVISDRLKQLARDLQVPIIALAQINREAEKGKSTLPTLANLKDSGSLEQDADAVMILHREREIKKGYAGAEIEHVRYEVYLAKNRFGKTGVLGIEADLAVNRFFDK